MLPRAVRKAMADAVPLPACAQTQNARHGAPLIEVSHLRLHVPAASRSASAVKRGSRNRLCQLMSSSDRCWINRLPGKNVKAIPP
jgi:hypothetical protein